MATVKILKGSYRNEPIINQEFTLVKPWQESAKGGLITVDGVPNWPGPRRINVGPQDYLVNGESPREVAATQSRKSKSKPIKFSEPFSNPTPRPKVPLQPGQLGCAHCGFALTAKDIPVVIEWGPSETVGKEMAVRTIKKAVHQECNRDYMMKSKKSAKEAE